ncbi:MAG: lipopolysaccharide assembly protein LapA domain-containing protein [Woeseia sp.]
MFKKLIALIVLVLIFVAMILFTRINPGQVRLDLAFGVVEPTIPMAFSLTFVAGWLFGLLSTSIFMLKLVNERRRLRNALRNTESEVSQLRSLPIADAD